MSANEPDSPTNLSNEDSHEAASPPESGRAVIFIGADLYNVATQHAIAVSYMARNQVSPAKFTQFLVKEYGGPAVNTLTDFLKSPANSLSDYLKSPANSLSDFLNPPKDN